MLNFLWKIFTIIPLFGPIVDSSRPTHPFYWFKRLYTFYQMPANKEVTLSDAIQLVQTPMLKTLTNTYKKLFNLIPKVLEDLSDLDRKMLSDARALSATLKVLEKMPSQLIEIAQEHGSITGLTEGKSSKDAVDVKSPRL